MTEKQIRRRTFCKTCGMCTYRGYKKYTCDGCGRPISGKHRKEMISEHVWHKGRHSEGEDFGAVAVHFHNLECWLLWIQNLTAEEIEKIDFHSYHLYGKDLLLMRKRLRNTER